MIVPHCLPLLRQFKCHINFEVAATSHIFQYLFKYIHKGPDYARYSLHVTDTSAGDPVDEIQDYWNSRYLSAGEAVWRILGYHITHKEPAVTALPIHLPTSRSHHQYHGISRPCSTLSLLERYFVRPAGTFYDNKGTLHHFDELSYMEYFTLFCLTSQLPKTVGYYEERRKVSRSPAMYVVLRSAKHHHVCRIETARPSQGEIFYLRAILQSRPLLSFTDGLSLDHQQFRTYQESTMALGLFSERGEAYYAIQEAVHTLYTPQQLRYLFIHLLVNDCVMDPLNLWEDFKHNISLDFVLLHHDDENTAHQLSLGAIGEALGEHGRSLQDFGLPQSTLPSVEVLHEQRKWSLHVTQHDIDARSAYTLMTQEQKEVFNAVVDAALTNTPSQIFVDGKAGTGKTFLVNAICSKLRSLRHIVLPMATAASAALLYPGGRTTHSTFKVPVNDNNEFLQSSISTDSPRAQLIKETSLIIWDEAPMANRGVLACVNDVCQKIMKSNVPFGGKSVVLLGDFRQTSPVIRGGSRKQIIDTSIRSSPLWEQFSIMRLRRPIRNAQDHTLAQFVDTIGDGGGPEIPTELFDHVTDADELIQFVFPQEVLAQPEACLRRAILCPTNEQIDSYNSTILRSIHGNKRVYTAADSLKEAEDAGLLPPESVLDYVAAHNPAGLPPHSLSVHVGGVYRLTRNFSLERGLAKNSRVVVTALGQ